MHRFFSEKGIDIEEYITSEISMPTQTAIYGKEFPILPPVANGLVLLAHIVFHLSAGLGFRQVIDWMMFVSREADDSFWNHYFKKAAEETGLDVIAITATKLCQQYLGLPNSISWCKTADDNLCDQLFESLLSSGNFGRKRGTGTVVEDVITKIKRNGLGYLQTTGEYNWEAYHRHKWLKPFAWMYQVLRYINKGLQTRRGVKTLKEDVKRGQQRTDLLKQLKLMR